MLYNYVYTCILIHLLLPVKYNRRCMCMKHIVGERINRALKAFSGVGPFTHEVNRVKIDYAITATDQK